MQGVIPACDKVAAQLPDDVKVIPGHGQLATLAEVREFSAILKETRDAMQAAIKQGKTVDQM